MLKPQTDSFIKSTHNRGLRLDPYGTPDLAENLAENLPDIFSLYAL